MSRLLPLLLALLLQACATPRMLPAATELKAGDAEVVVIGKIELVPPLSPLEQKSHWNVVGEKRMLGHVFMATSPTTSRWHQSAGSLRIPGRARCRSGARPSW
jgi:hypothetical protein